MFSVLNKNQDTPDYMDRRFTMASLLMDTSINCRLNMINEEMVVGLPSGEVFTAALIATDYGYSTFIKKNEAGRGAIGTNEFGPMHEKVFYGNLDAALIALHDPVYIEVPYNPDAPIKDRHSVAPVWLAAPDNDDRQVTNVRNVYLKVPVVTSGREYSPKTDSSGPWSEIGMVQFPFSTQTLSRLVANHFDESWDDDSLYYTKCGSPIHSGGFIKQDDPLDHKWKVANEGICVQCEYDMKAFEQAVPNLKDEPRNKAGKR
jgi:hypothetical protein